MPKVIFAEPTPGEARNNPHIQRFRPNSLSSPSSATNCRWSGIGESQDLPSQREEPPATKFLESLIRNWQLQIEFQNP